MTTNDYHFITHWRVKSTVDEVSKILGDPLALMRWWPSVYLDVKVVEPGEESGLGRVVSLYTKGWLPYTLRWDFRVTEVRKDGFTLARLHAASREELVRIPAPPQPPFRSPVLLLLGATAVFAIGGILLYFVVRLFSRD